MPTITTKDGAQIFYKDWGTGQPVVFSHGWPLNADAWDEQLYFFSSNGFRAIAHDRRGHGRSTQTRNGNNMDTYADDLATLTKELDLKKAIHIGHSTGGGEVAHYIGRHGTKRVAKAVLVDAVPPLMVKGKDNLTVQDLQPAIGLDLVITGAGRVADAVLKTINPFSIWGLFLMALGISVTHKQSKGNAWIAVLVSFGVILLLSAGFAAACGRQMGG